MVLIASGKVSVFWQMIFGQIPFVQLWATYRIKKLILFLILIVIPYVIANQIAGLYSIDFISEIITEILNGNFLAPFTMIPLWWWVFDIHIAILVFYLMAKWSIDWNAQFP